MSRIRRACARLGALLLLSSSACRPPAQVAPTEFLVGEIGLRLPYVPGWHADPAVKLEDAAKGGVAFRLVRDSSMPGSPRVEVVLDPVSARAMVLEDALARALRDMAEFERRGEIQVQSLERRAMAVGPRRAFRVTHRYSVGAGPDAISITQTSTLFVLDGRAVTVTAAGRTELLTPLATEIDQLLGTMTIGSVPGSAAGRVEELKRSPLVQPVDLKKHAGGD